MVKREPLKAIYIYTPSPGEAVARQHLIELLAGLLDSSDEQVSLEPSGTAVVGCAVVNDKKKTSRRSTAKAKTLADLTWDGLETWAGRRIVRRGQAYHRQGAVRDLAQTSDGAVVAWVRGERRYATKVEIGDKGKLQSICTCPYYTTCKHAVALVLTYLDELKNERAVPLSVDDDPRLAEIAKMEARTARLFEGDDDDSDGDDVDDDGWEDEDQDAPPPRRTKPGRRSEPLWRALVEGMTRDQLLALVEELATEFDDVRMLLEHRSSLLEGREGELVKKVRAAIRDLREPQWDEDWGHPSVDLGQLKEQLEALLKKGHADALVQLGPDLLTGANRTVESEHEGESSYELGECLAVVFRALRQSTLPPDQQIDVAVEMELADEHDLCGDAPGKIFSGRHPQEVWRAAATRLQARLKRLASPADSDGFGARYHRDRLVDHLVHALEKSGQEDEIIPLCEREAQATNNYVRVVDRLLAVRRIEEAERWCVRGLQDVGNFRGLADNLRGRLEQIARKGGEPLRAVALKADVFFEEPSLETFQALASAARKEKVGPAVDAWARHFLVTGQRPTGVKGKRPRDEPVTPWPLPESGVAAHPPRRQVEAPMTQVLIQIAIAEKDADGVLRWYDDQRGRRGWWGSLDMEVATAVGHKYPDRAVAIYTKHAEAAINKVNPRGYEEGAAILRHAKQVLMKAGRKEEWVTYLTQLREKNRGRPRCIEELDRLERGRRRIVEH